MRADWIVRSARPSDADSIGAAHVRSWRQAYQGILPHRLLADLDEARSAARWLQWIEQPDGPAVLVAEADSVLAAFGAVGPVREPKLDAHPELRTGELYSLYADPAVFGTGAGWAVHEAAMAHLAGQGYRHAVLWVLEANAAARRFYRRQGWRDDEVGADYQHSGVSMPTVRYSRQDIRDSVRVDRRPGAG
jgi:ribosomal protein S18 acetylase RimI-like enzyme